MTPLDADGGLWDLVERRAAATPDRMMVIDTYGRQLTFAGYRDIAEEVAAALRSGHGVEEGSVVSWQLPTSLEALVLMAALARTGAIQNPLVPMLRDREVGFIVEQVDADLLIVPRRWRGFDHETMAAGVAARSGTSVLAVQPPEGPGAHELGLPHRQDGPRSSPAAAGGVRWLYYSSGTTADPKGCRHTDASVMAAANGLVEVFGFGPDDVYPVAFPLAHIGGMTALTTLLRTAHLLQVVDPFDPERSPLDMAEVGATVLGSALPFFRAYLAAQRAAGTSPLYPLLRACLAGGAPKPPALHEEVRRVLGGAGVLGSWGLTECPIATLASPHDHDNVLARTEGRPVPGVEVQVRDAAGGVLAEGEEGSLWVRGPQLFAGYVGASDGDCFDGAGWFDTGDLGVVETTGHVAITGRTKDIIIRNAENLSAIEIENVLSTMEAVADVAVVGLPHERTGEQACAVVVLVDGAAAPTLADVGAHCASHGLARQKHPERLVTVDALPRNSLGKLLKREIRTALLEGGP